MTDNALTPVDAEIQALHTEMRDPKGPYWTGPQAKTKQEKYRQLVDTRDSGVVAPKKDKRALEIDAIHAAMADQNSEYWSGPKTNGETALQRQYRQILDGGTGDGADGDWRAPVSEVKQSLAPAVVANLVEEWGAGPEFEKNIHRVQDVAALVVGALSEGTAAVDFTTAFETLPAPVKAAVYREIALPAASFVRPPDERDMATFRLWAGQETIDVWGTDAHRKIGIALDRFERIEKSLSKAELKEFAYVWNHITARERQLSLWALGSSK